MLELTNLEVAVAKVFESSPAELSNRTRKEQAQWWTDYYRPRPGEMEKFNDFLGNDESPLCRITGGVGAGKTTFVLEKIFRPRGRRVCNGFWVDFSCFSDRLRKVEADALADFSGVSGQDQAGLVERDVEKVVSSRVADALTAEIARRVVDRLHFHFLLLRSGRIPESLRRRDCFYILDIDFAPIDEGEVIQFESSAWLDVAATLLVLSSSAKRAAQKSRIISMGGQNNKKLSLTEAIDLVREALESDRELSTDLIDYIEELRRSSDISTLQSLLSTYSKYFRHEDPVVILDNLDQAPNSDLHKTIFDYVDRLALSLKSMDVGGVPISTSAMGQQSAPIRSRQFKIVYLLRDENIRSSNKKTSTRSYNEYKISLAQPGEGYVGDGPPEYIEMNDDVLHEIVSKRLQVVRRSIPSAWEKQFEQFEQVVSAVWSPITGQQQTAILGRILLGKITNFSIQVALSMAHQLCLQIVRDIQSDGRDLSDYLQTSYQIAFRGRVVNWLLGHDETGRPLTTCARREVDLIKDSSKGTHLCCAHRLILTYLHNRLSERDYFNPRVYVGEVTTHLERVSGLPSEHVKNVIFQLYQPQDSQREYLTLCEGPAVHDPKSITDTHDISLNPRGRTFLLKIMPRLEYWRYLTSNKGISPSQGADTVGECLQTGKTIFECTPQEAVAYVEPIIKNLSELAGAHQANWIRLVKKYATVANKEKPFASFWERNGMTVGETFYLERVANSHLAELQTYVSEMFRGEESSILLTDERKKSFLKSWPRLKSHVLRTRDAKKMLGYYLENHDTTPQGRVAAEKIILFVAKYEEIVTLFRDLKQKTLLELDLMQIEP